MCMRLRLFVSSLLDHQRVSTKKQSLRSFLTLLSICWIFVVSRFSIPPSTPLTVKSLHLRSSWSFHPAKCAAWRSGPLNLQVSPKEFPDSTPHVSPACATRWRKPKRVGPLKWASLAFIAEATGKSSFNTQQTLASGGYPGLLQSAEKKTNFESWWWTETDTFSLDVLNFLRGSQKKLLDYYYMLKYLRTRRLKIEDWHNFWRYILWHNAILSKSEKHLFQMPISISWMPDAWYFRVSKMTSPPSALAVHEGQPIRSTKV